MTPKHTNPDPDSREDAFELAIRARHGDLADEEKTRFRELRAADSTVASEARAVDGLLARFENARIEPSAGHRAALQDRLADLVREDVREAAAPARSPGPVRRLLTALWGPVEGDGRLILGRSLAVACGVFVAIVLFQVAGPESRGLSSSEKARIVEQAIGRSDGR